jgi:50S ribosomal subunit-associated GTPase HflX
MVEDQIASVERLLCILDLTRIPTILVLNKTDRLKGGHCTDLLKKLDGIPISALDRASLSGLRKEVEARIF